MEKKYLSLIKYVSSNGVNEVVNIEKKDTVNEHIKALVSFHKISKGYESAFCRFPCCIGKVFENYKMMLRKYEKYLHEIRSLGPDNKFQNTILKYGDEYGERAQKSIEQVYASNYIELIKRSMKNGEICLGNTSLKNIGFKNENEIEIVSFQKCCNNMVEMDGVSYLMRNNIKDLKASKEIITLFCKEEGLEENSLKYMEALIRYPYLFIRCCIRYKEKPNKWSAEEYIMKLEKAMRKES